VFITFQQLPTTNNMDTSKTPSGEMVRYMKENKMFFEKDQVKKSISVDAYLPPVNEASAEMIRFMEENGMLSHTKI